jgi:hypothetical protein
MVCEDNHRFASVKSGKSWLRIKYSYVGAPTLGLFLSGNFQNLKGFTRIPFNMGLVRSGDLFLPSTDVRDI